MYPKHLLSGVKKVFSLPHLLLFQLDDRALRWSAGLNKFMWYIQGRSLTGVWGRATPPNFEYLPFRMAKTAVRCTFAWQLTGPELFAQLLLLKRKRSQKTSQEQGYNTL